jgi:hypothetical protein
LTGTLVDALAWTPLSPSRFSSTSKCRRRESERAKACSLEKI